jgi:hypothetical protein
MAVINHFHINIQSCGVGCKIGLMPLRLHSAANERRGKNKQMLFHGCFVLSVRHLFSLSQNYNKKPLKNQPPSPNTDFFSVYKLQYFRKQCITKIQIQIFFTPTGRKRGFFPLF